MSDPQASRVPPDADPVPPPRRVIHDWEYHTSYLPALQVRSREGLHAALIEWAGSEGRSLDDLAVQILEEEIRRRGG